MIFDIHELHGKFFSFNLYVTGSMKTRPNKTKRFIWMFIPITYSIIYHYLKEKNRFLRRKSNWGFWSTWGPSFGFSVIGFLTDRFSRVLSNRFFTWVISALFPAWNLLLLFFNQKQTFCFKFYFQKELHT